MDNVLHWLDLHPYMWPVFIIVARVVDVSIGTIRTICVVRGYRTVSAILGFCEVIIWLTAVSGVLREITVVKVISYGVGFALGNATGVWLEQKLALGQQLVMMISRGKAHAVAAGLRLGDFIVTEMAAKGGNGDVAMCFAVVSRRCTKQVAQIAEGVDPNVILLLADVRRSNLSRRPIDGPVTGWRAVLKKK